LAARRLFPENINAGIVAAKLTELALCISRIQPLLTVVSNIIVWSFISFDMLHVLPTVLKVAAGHVAGSGWALRAFFPAVLVRAKFHILRVVVVHSYIPLEVHHVEKGARAYHDIDSTTDSIKWITVVRNGIEWLNCTGLVGVLSNVVMPIVRAVICQRSPSLIILGKDTICFGVKSFDIVLPLIDVLDNINLAIGGPIVESNSPAMDWLAI
jgi:hypothetical protein